MTIQNSQKTAIETEAEAALEAHEPLIQSLQNSEAIIQALLDLSPFPITITRIDDGRFMLVNQRQSKITGYSPDQIIGRTPQEVNMYVNQADRERMLQVLHQHGQLDKFETRFRTKDGRFIHAQVSGRLINYQGQDCLITTTTYVDSLSKAQQALRESENRFSNILNSITESYYEVDLRGHLTFCNESIPTLFGRTAEELKGLSFKATTAPEDIQKVFKSFNDIYKGVSSTQLIEYGILRKDGTTLTVEASICLLRDNAGQPIGFYGILRDRTKQKAAEEALRRSEEKYRKILEEMEEGYYEIDLKGNFSYLNRAEIERYGYTADELIGMNYREYLSPEQAKRAFQLFSDVYATGNSIRINDHEIFRKNGSLCISEISGYPLRDHRGEIVGFWGISRDRTEQKQAELALQKSEEQYRLLVENANDGIYITQEGRIKFHNPKIAQLTGYANEVLTDMEFIALVHPEDKAAVYEVQQRRIAQGQIPDLFAFRILNKEKQIVWAELSVIGITWEGRPAALNFLRDVTHQKKTEARLLQAEKMEAIGTLAGGIAHDFNNILSAILGYTELALDEVRQETVLEDNLKEVFIAGKRAKDLVQQILAFARQSDEKIKPIVVSTIAREVLKLIRSSIPTTIEIRPAIASDSSILGNPIQVHQIIMNLCTNAAHAMEKSGGILAVNLSNIHATKANAEAHLNLADGDYLKLAVSDTGCGIAPEIMNCIFEPYFTTKGPGEGTGMGLSVVLGIVENYGGKITVQSELGKGATFTIYLPISSQATECSPSMAEELAAYSERILFVDDEPAIVKMGSRILEQQGYKVTTQTSSLEALKLFRARPNDFDLVISDMTMPQMTGDHLASEMMRIRPNIPVVLCTGYSKQINEELAIKIGIKAFVFKPIVKKDLAATIRKVLDERAKARLV